MREQTSPKSALDETGRFERLVGAVTEYAICLIDPEGAVATWNAGAAAIFGYAPNEVIGQSFARFFTTADRENAVPRALLDEARRSGRAESERWQLRKDGSRFAAVSTVQPVKGDAGELLGFASITRDVTERRAAQRALADSEHRFRLFIEGVVDYAICTLDASGVVTDWNMGAERMKGYAAAEVLGRHFSLFYTDEDRAAGLPTRALERAARDGWDETEGWRLRKDGSRFWASVALNAIRDAQGKLLGFAKITRDITERRAAQEALRESERQFRLLVAGVTDYALFMLDPNGVVSSWNPGAERIKGYRAEEIIGQHFSRFYTERDRAQGGPARALKSAAATGRFEQEGWRVRKDGSLFWAHIVIDAIRDEAGELAGFAKITRDITERREAEIALEADAARREQAQRMEALGQLTGGVAHDFNNLLMVVSGHLETLRALARDDPRGIRAADAIERAARHGEALTRQLLTFARRQTLAPVVTSLKERLDTVRAMLESSVGSAVQLAIAVPPDTWPVRIDVNEFELALVNLALNARDAMPQGGVIAIAAENARLDRDATPSGLAGDFVALTVADSGEGIPPDILAHVFEPFFTTKEAGKGSGLGLSQVHGFVHQSGGTVTVASELGRGTRVTLYLPRDLSRAEAAPEAPPAAAERPSGRRSPPRRSSSRIIPASPTSPR
jgi:PAS domain S-box-containing protein